MSTGKTFTVFGQPVEVLASSRSTSGSFTALTQTCQPGEGVPPHVHANEDEFFTVLEGEFELFDGERWSKLEKGQSGFKLRGQPHAFRASGTGTGKMLVFCSPGGLDEYLESISKLTMPQDLERLVQISEPRGIRFLPPRGNEAAGAR